ncbi:hypothetical protein DF185_22015 [Marinifilum breve]|uniref:Transmembrane protein n=1 Tax=Marinifilum breve TaxID=2184082 RepID=A0A2V3ZRA0_9BACT|nr:hypothetical protein DF185_22015 [Marinifilum breve]
MFGFKINLQKGFFLLFFQFSTNLQNTNKNKPFRNKKQYNQIKILLFFHILVCTGSVFLYICCKGFQLNLEIG